VNNARKGHERGIRFMREYVAALRGVWRSMSDGQPFELEGRALEVFSRGLRPPRPALPPPLLVAGVSAGMARLAGEVGDGIVDSDVSLAYKEKVVFPSFMAGARKSRRESPWFVSYVICAVSDDRREAERRARMQVARCLSHAVHQECLRWEGLEGELGHVREAVAAGSQERVAAALPANVVDKFAIHGTAGECQSKLARYAFQQQVPHMVVLHSPYFGVSPEVERDNFLRVVEAFGAPA